MAREYKDVVRMVELAGPWSRELCGGTHVRSTAQIGLVNLLGEQSVGSGIRRVEALVSADAFAKFAAERALVAGLSADEVGALVIAYEPVWAIGTGEVATPEDAQEVCGAIRGRVAELVGQAAADAVRIQYGGSAKSSNIVELMAQPDVDGGLVGGASLDAAEFAKIVTFYQRA